MRPKQLILLSVCAFHILSGSVEAAKGCSVFARGMAESAARIIVKTRFDSDPALYVTRSRAENISSKIPGVSLHQLQLWMGIGGANEVNPLANSDVLVTALERRAGDQLHQGIIKVESLDRAPRSPGQLPRLEKDLKHQIAYAVWAFAKLNAKMDHLVSFPRVVRISGSARGRGLFSAIIPTPIALEGLISAKRVEVQIDVAPRSRQFIRSIEIVNWEPE